MDFVLLKKSHLKRNIIIGVAVVLIISAVILNFTWARYRITESIPLVNGTINYKPYDFKVMAMYQENDSGEYETINIMPSSGYIINEEKSYCTLDNVNKDPNVKLYTNSNNENVIANLQTNSKCYLYFDRKETISDIILANKTVLTRDNFSIAFTETTTGIIYSSEDDDGTTYYFAGNPTDNWVSFAGFYWRIIRINGDGTLRMIYRGNSINSSGDNRYIGTSNYNNSYTDYVHVGYMYSNSEVHGTSTNSTIKSVIDQWYQNNLLNNYAELIDANAGFCNDRTPSTSGTTIDGKVGTYTYYAGFIRLVTNKAPSFKCMNSSDLFTTPLSNKGNKALTYPIGLITADEVAYAGSGVNIANSSYYLASGGITMTPSYHGGGSAKVFQIYSEGDLGLEGYVSNSYAIQPVINLK